MALAVGIVFLLYAVHKTKAQAMRVITFTEIEATISDLIGKNTETLTIDGLFLKDFFLQNLTLACKDIKKLKGNKNLSGYREAREHYLLTKGDNLLVLTIKCEKAATSLITKDFPLDSYADESGHVATISQIDLSFSLDKCDVDCQTELQTLVMSTASDAKVEYSLEPLKSESDTIYYELAANYEGVYPSAVAFEHEPIKYIDEAYASSKVNCKGKIYLPPMTKAIEAVVEDLSTGGNVVITGPMRVGKSTLLAHIMHLMAERNYSLFRLDYNALSKHLSEVKQVLRHHIALKKAEGYDGVLLVLDESMKVFEKDSDVVGVILDILNGLENKSLKCPVIAVINKDAEAVDPRVISPGRVSTIVEIGTLNRTQTKTLTNLVLKDNQSLALDSSALEDEMTLADIFNIALRPKPKESKTEDILRPYASTTPGGKMKITL